MSVHLTPKEFDQLVEQAIARIPARFRRRMVNLAIVVQPHPPEPGLLGLYEGRPITQRSTFDPATLPDRIRIFQRPHEEMALSRSDLEQSLFETVWHEVGHYFGLDEREVRAVEQRHRRLRLLRSSAARRID